MDPLVKPALLLALCPAPAVLAWALVSRQRQMQRVRLSAASHGLRRRPPGESIRARIEDLDLQILSWMTYLAVCPAILGLIIALLPARGMVVPISLLAVAIVWTGVCGLELRRLNRHRAAGELAFNARRLVAEQLNRLSSEGFEIYHEVPVDGFTLDHVAIGPPGVFAIETRTAFKPRGIAAKEVEERLVFDGFQVKGSSESYGLETVVAQARALRQWLNERLQQDVEVTPIMTLAGCSIECTATHPSVLVLNPKELANLCDLKLVALKEELIRRIAHALNQK